MIGVKREFGDYQTPNSFSDKVCKFISSRYSKKFDTIIEPTCGIGGFLKSSLSLNAKQYIGIEINAEYCQICKQHFIDDRVQIINKSIFDISINSIVNKDDSILVIGNPPWVTNSTLSSIHSNNLPKKTNFKGINGLEAITGGSNFDICEYIIISILRELKYHHVSLAMLCKTSVARNVFSDLARENIRFNTFCIYNFDAHEVFDIAANACLLIIDLSKEDISHKIMNIYNFDYPSKLISSYEMLNGKLSGDLTKNTDDFDGKCQFIWRQGIKHDCSNVMELKYINGKLVNGFKEVVDIEKTLVFPLIKSSSFKSIIVNKFSRYVIVTQKKTREDTKMIESIAPKTWSYLNSNIDFFQNRKSSIYKNSPYFSMFGVGDYSYFPYKVGISGFYKNPIFSLLYSEDKIPVMVDDTGYFLSFNAFNDAYLTMLLLNHNRTLEFIKSISFKDAKRPYTKKVLDRIDIFKILNTIRFDDLKKLEKKLNLNDFLTTEIIYNFRNKLNNSNICQGTLL